MLTEQDKILIAFFRKQAGKEATAKMVMDALNYPSVGAVNLRVVRLAKKVSEVFSYTPITLDNGQQRWWPCLFDGRNEGNSFVWILKKEIEDWYESVYPNEDFILKVYLSFRDDSVARAKRLTKAPTKPKRIVTKVLSFERNPDVVAEILCLANGKCQKCASLAPFFRKSDGTPYLEVHHKVPLAFGGEDTVKNAIALCPNCHREAHYG